MSNNIKLRVHFTIHRFSDLSDNGVLVSRWIDAIVGESPREAFEVWRAADGARNSERDSSQRRYCGPVNGTDALLSYAGKSERFAGKIDVDDRVQSLSELAFQALTRGADRS